MGRDQFKSSYGAFSARERDLERSRAQRDAREAAAQAAASAPTHPAGGVPDGVEHGAQTGGVRIVDADGAGGTVVATRSAVRDTK